MQGYRAVNMKTDRTDGKNCKSYSYYMLISLLKSCLRWSWTLEILQTWNGDGKENSNGMISD